MPTFASDLTANGRHEAFEYAWRDHRPGAPVPRWSDYLPPEEQTCPPDFVFLLLQTDVECRIKKGYPALLSEPYFAHPRLQGGALSDDQRRQLVRWEYQLRWNQGERARRDEYLARFPDLAGLSE